MHKDYGSYSVSIPKLVATYLVYESKVELCKFLMAFQTHVHVMYGIH